MDETQKADWLYIQNVKYNKVWVAAIAPWFRLRLPSCGPGFESQAHHLCFFQFVLLKLYQENNENKQKRPELAHFYKIYIMRSCTSYCDNNLIL